MAKDYEEIVKTIKAKKGTQFKEILATKQKILIISKKLKGGK